jgi:hypothetical protein
LPQTGTGAADMTKTLLKLLFTGIIAAMLYVTLTAGFDRNLFDASRELWSHGWFKATLADAYFGFLTFWVWVAYKERRLWRSLAWFVLIMGLGNMAMAAYVLIELFRLADGQSMATLLTRRNG